MQPILSFHLGLGPTLALSAALESPLTSLHQCHHLQAPPFDQSDTGMTMPWLGMATPCHSSPLSPQRHAIMSWTLLVLSWTSPCPPLVKPTRAHASSHAPRTLQRRHAAHGRDARARQNAASPRQQRPRLAISALAWTHLSTRTPSDTTTSSPAPGHRRGGRRRPPQ
jgi:hypothetical protein